MQSINEAERNLTAMRNLMLTPDPDPEPLDYCDYCGEPMYEGETVWDIGGDIICEDCARINFAKVLRDE